jgi:hypothetical protein
VNVLVLKNEIDVKGLSQAKPSQAGRIARAIHDPDRDPRQQNTGSRGSEGQHSLAQAQIRADVEPMDTRE